MKLAAISSYIHRHISQWGFQLISAPLISVPLMTTGLAVGTQGIHSPVAVAPEIAPVSYFHSAKASFPPALNTLPLDALRALRDRRSSSSSTASSAATLVALGDGSSINAHRAVADRLPLDALDARLHVEEMAYYHWITAEKLARRARHLEQQRPLTMTRLEESDAAWLAAIQQLKHIPPGVLVVQNVADRIAEYQQQRRQLAYRSDTHHSRFLRHIVESAGVDVDVAHITVCSLEQVNEMMPLGECRRLRGDRPPASPASLIKVPIAVAMMQKITESQIDLSTEIYVDPHNFTEDASDISVGAKHSLQRVAARMINQSSNIATNQLIDYLGFEYINTVLRDRGYPTLQVGHKLVGDRIFPAQFGTQGTNRITTDELTAMMVDIYLQKRPGNVALREMLATQTDDRMGQAALNRRGMEWLGEKTGWNSKVLGTTMAAVIGGDRYIITVALNHTWNPTTMQAIVSGIADHILEQGGF